MKSSIVRAAAKAVREYRPLSSTELSTLKEKGWYVMDGHLVKKFGLPSHTMAAELVRRTAATADSLQHHPEVHIKYRFSTFVLKTNDKDTISDYDLRLAESIDETASDLVKSPPKP